MLLVRPEACAALARRAGTTPLRLDVGEDGDVHLQPAERRTTDLSFTHLGHLVLLVDGQTAIELDGQELVPARSETEGDGGVTLRPREPGPPLGPAMPGGEATS